MNKWSEKNLDTLADSDEIEILTERPDGALIATTIWVVRVDDDLFVRSAYGDQGRWYRRADTRPLGQVRVGDVRRTVEFQPADPALSPAIDAAYRRKYGSYPPNILGPMVSPVAAATSLRLVPKEGHDAASQPDGWNRLD